MKFIVRWGWVGAILFGITLIGAGLFMVREARQAHDEVRTALAAERIVTPEDAEIRVRVHGQTPAHVVFEVEDTGAGIAPESMRRIFDPFYSSRSGGTGLGLSTAHSIVSAHGGKIRVSSSPAEGTEFVVVLPRAVPDPAPSPSPA